MTEIRRYAFLKKKEKEIKAELEQLKKKVYDKIFTFCIHFCSCELCRN